MGLLYDKMKDLLDDPDFIKGVVNELSFKGKSLNMPNLPDHFSM